MLHPGCRLDPLKSCLKLAQLSFRSATRLRLQSPERTLTWRDFSYGAFHARHFKGALLPGDLGCDAFPVSFKAAF